jgi:hypothetical protein
MHNKKLPLVHIEALPGDQMNLKMNNPPECAKMIWNVCNMRPDIGAIFITGIVGYCRENNINWADMEKLGKIHKVDRK